MNQLEKPDSPPLTDGDYPPDAVPRRVLASVDPLAIDSRARALVDELRADAGDSPVNEKVLGWLQEGYELGLGTLRHDVVRVAL